MDLKAVAVVWFLGVLTVSYAQEESLSHVNRKAWQDKKDGIKPVEADNFFQHFESTPATEISIYQDDAAKDIDLEKRIPKDNVEEHVSFLVVKDSSHNKKRIFFKTEVKKNEEENNYLTNNNQVKSQTFEEAIPEQVKKFCSSRNDISEIQKCLLVCRFPQFLSKKIHECSLLSPYEKAVENKQTSSLSTLSKNIHEDRNHKVSLIANKNYKYDDKGKADSMSDESEKLSSINSPSRVSKNLRRSKRNIAEPLSNAIGNTSIYGIHYTTHGPTAYSVSHEEIYDATARANGLSTDWLKRIATIVYADGQSRYALFKANFRSGYRGEVTVYF